MNYFKQIVSFLNNKWRKPKYLQSKRKLVIEDMNAYQCHHGYYMNINNPQTFTEKIQWYKLYYDGGGYFKENC